MPNSYNNKVEHHNIYKDFLKSTYIHIFLVLIVVLITFLQNYINNSKNIKINLPNIVKKSHQNPNSNNKNLHETPIIHANLIDKKTIQEAINRQDSAAKDQLMRQQKLKQQEQQLAQLKKNAEQEVLKLKQETAKIKKAEEQTKYDQEQLKKQHQELQKTAEQLKKQAKELHSQQEKLAKIKSQIVTEKKKIQETITNPEIIKNSKDLKLEQKENVLNQSANFLHNQQNTTGEQNGITDHIILTKQEIYQAKWKASIINNRKKFNLFSTNIMCAIKIKLQPDGKLALVKIDQSSGNIAYDSFSEQAIYKSEPFEMPNDPALNKELTEKEYIFEFYDHDFQQA